MQHLATHCLAVWTRSHQCSVKTWKSIWTTFWILNNISLCNQTWNHIAGATLMRRRTTMDVHKSSWVMLWTHYLAWIQRVSETGMKNFKWWETSQRKILLKEHREIELCKRYTTTSYKQQLKEHKLSSRVILFHWTQMKLKTLKYSFTTTFSLVSQWT